MSDLNVVPIVEGHGEQAAVRILLTRIWNEILGREYLNVLSPIRMSRSKLAKEAELLRAIDIAEVKLRFVENNADGFVLVLIDADEDPACILGPELLSIIHTQRAHVDVAVVLAMVEYETWFVCAAESLGRYLQSGAAASAPRDPESARAGKGWVQQFALAHKYSEPVEQPRMTAAMDLMQLRMRSRSFDKLCRELEKRGKRAAIGE